MVLVAVQVSALERFYRFFWRNKGDVYHVLWDLTRCEGQLCRHVCFKGGQIAATVHICLHWCPTKCLWMCWFEEQCMWHRFLDGRVWPQEDEKQVKLMMAMIHHCTGVFTLCQGSSMQLMVT